MVTLLYEWWHINLDARVGTLVPIAIGYLLGALAIRFIDRRILAAALVVLAIILSFEFAIFGYESGIPELRQNEVLKTLFAPLHFPSYIATALAAGLAGWVAFGKAQPVKAAALSLVLLPPTVVLMEHTIGMTCSVSRCVY